MIKMYQSSGAFLLGIKELLEDAFVVYATGSGTSFPTSLFFGLLMVSSGVLTILYRDQILSVNL
ncbi:MAG: hypothetical protein QW752_05590 [Thermoplasmata archaeon]